MTPFDSVEVDMLAFLQLLRIPTVFTAMADIALGFVLTHRFIYGPLINVENGQLEPEVGWNDPHSFFCLLASSSCLYLSGMVFNDVFDRQQDAAERSVRPIPSGRVSVKSATILGIILTLSGLALAAFVGRFSLQVALLLVVAILAYDGVLKKTFLGPIAMGSCRFLNVFLGGSVWTQSLPEFQGQFLLGAAIGLGAFVTGITIFARTEAKVSNRWQLILALFVMNAAFVTLAMMVQNSPNDAVASAMFCVIAFTVNRRGFKAVLDPSPATVQGSVKVLLFSLVMIDATLIYWYSNTPEAVGFGSAQGLATTALLIPAILLGKVIPMT